MKILSRDSITCAGTKRDKWDAAFLKLGERSGTVWVVPLASDEPGYPKLHLVAFEGMASSGLIAEAGTADGRRQP